MYPSSGDSSPGGQWPTGRSGDPPGSSGQPFYHQAPPPGPADYPPSDYPPADYPPPEYPPPGEPGGGYPPQPYGGQGGYPPAPQPTSGSGGYPPQPYGGQDGYPSPAGGYPPQPGGYPSPTGQPVPLAPYGSPPPQRRSKLPLILSLVAVAVLLICGIAVIIGISQTKLDPPPDALATTAPYPTSTARQPAAPKPSTGPSEEEIDGDLDGFEKGDCLTMTDDTNKVDDAKCTAAGAYKVLLRKDGTISDSVCDSTAATDILTHDETGTSGDFVLCIAKVKK